ncbi:MAG TPA: holo-ACP synthase [Planctomycetota bacterium]|nr:holo-ACP synthase [Planctomycetota bacterium]
MRPLALGLDVVHVPRFAAVLRRRGARFVARVFTERERAWCESRPRPAESFAARFAAKEAVLKALGVGWAKGLEFRDVEVRRAASGAPSVTLHGGAARAAKAAGVESWLLTLTHAADVAVACALGLGAPRAARTGKVSSKRKTSPPARPRRSRR